jgi:hypothetical protein
VKLFFSVALTAVTGYVAVALLSRRPILVHTLGVSDCACGAMVAKTTRHVIWNPLRDRTPESTASSFLETLREGNCAVKTDWCADALTRHRVSSWQLAYREDTRDMVSLYFRLTKYGGGPAYYLQGVGAVDLRRNRTGWAVIGYDAYF